MDEERIMRRGTEFSERYNHHSQEPYWQKFWGQKEIFRFNPEASGSLLLLILRLNYFRSFIWDMFFLHSGRGYSRLPKNGGI